MELLDDCLTFLGVPGFLLACIVFVPLERLLPLRSDQRVLRSGWANDLVHLFANGILVRGTLAILVLAAGAIAHRAVPEGMRAAVAAQPYWLQTAAAIVLADVGFYLAHRMFHTIPLLWRFHAIHHSIEELDWLAATRVHPVDQIVTKAVSMMPLFALGFAPVPIAIFSAIYAWHSLLLHANVKLSFGPLRWLIASPEFHRWHHANERQAHNANYAGQLAILDCILGTMHLPKGRLPARYGVDFPLPRTYVRQALYPFTPQTKPDEGAGSL